MTCRKFVLKGTAADLIFDISTYGSRGRNGNNTAVSAVGKGTAGDLIDNGITVFVLAADRSVVASAVPVTVEVTA